MCFVNPIYNAAKPAATADENLAELDSVWDAYGETDTDTEDENEPESNEE